jgi:hypothetical protein
MFDVSAGIWVSEDHKQFTVKIWGDVKYEAQFFLDVLFNRHHNCVVVELNRDAVEGTDWSTKFNLSRRLITGAHMREEEWLTARIALMIDEMFDDVRKLLTNAFEILYPETRCWSDFWDYGDRDDDAILEIIRDAVVKFDFEHDFWDDDEYENDNDPPGGWSKN